MYTVSVFLRDRLVEVARRRYASREAALSGKLGLMEEFKRLGVKFRVTSVKKIGVIVNE